MLGDRNSNSSGRDLANAASDFRVRYGAMQSADRSGKTKVAFGEPRTVFTPEKGMRFDV